MTTTNGKAPDSEFKGLMIGLPCYGGSMSIETHSSLIHLRDVLNKVGLPVQEYALTMCNIISARNCMTTAWYDTCPEFDRLLMIDNDMQFSAKLIIDMIKLDKPVVGAVYSKRQLPIDMITGQRVDARSLVIGEQLPGEHPVIDGFQQWKYLGGGVLMIKREVITAMLKKFPDLNSFSDPGALSGLHITRVIKCFNEMETPEGRELSEDYSFCERAAQCGFPIWAAVDHPIGHIGKLNYCINPAEMLGLKPTPQDTLLDLAPA